MFRSRQIGLSEVTIVLLIFSPVFRSANRFIAAAILLPTTSLAARIGFC